MESEVFFSLGIDELFKNDNPTQAIYLFSKFIEKYPNSFYAYYYRGLAYAENRNYYKAFLDFCKAITINPLEPSLYYARLLAYSKFISSISNIHNIIHNNTHNKILTK